LGEGLLNDMMAILFLRVMEDSYFHSKEEFQAPTLFKIIKGLFVKILESIPIGMVFGFIISYITKKMRFIA